MRMLDLYCGGGGAAMGYHRAGIAEIVGVDIVAQPRFPFEFVQADALEYLEKYGHEFDAIHASPPCQIFMQWSNKSKHLDLLTPTLGLLQTYKTPWIVENIMGAPMPATVILCGSSFNLRVRRHRKFATNFFVPALPCRHAEQGPIVTVVGNFPFPPTSAMKPRSPKDMPDAMDAMGIDWMVKRELRQAIPPAYTEYIGYWLLEYVRQSRIARVEMGWAR